MEYETVRNSDAAESSQGTFGPAILQEAFQQLRRQTLLPWPLTGRNLGKHQIQRGCLQAPFRRQPMAGL